MNQPLNEQELVQYIADKTKADAKSIRIVLKHEQAYMDKLHKNAKTDIEIDSDEVVDYVLRQSDVKLDELKVEAILDAEMKYLIDNGLADYDD
ncbi:hypothetical protein FE784_38260 [Paenibacillus hemerocallicola]|uniref:Uncharacterized protein n=1 Tax=Paenibacillus hemerocallicola TaxID=1172614 RepID=A0A5C4SY89_9BACL|nr:hypothetical protein [Paenibacillus hemerocallicola]TNJ57723.1 hypothetical protein FE784_38260 [Paenibacillus hemerocallicola]